MASIFEILYIFDVDSMLVQMELGMDYGFNVDYICIYTDSVWIQYGPNMDQSLELDMHSICIEYGSDIGSIWFQ